MLLSTILFYCQGVDVVLHQCLTHEDTEKVLNDCYNRTCGGHLFGMAISQENFVQGSSGLHCFTIVSSDVKDA